MPPPSPTPSSESIHDPGLADRLAAGGEDEYLGRFRLDAVDPLVTLFRKRLATPAVAHALPLEATLP